MSALGEAARVFVTVGLNSDAARKGLQSFSKEVEGFTGRMNAWGKAVGASFQKPLEVFGELGDAADGVREVGNVVKGVAQTLLSGAARNEQYATSFEVLLGSAEKADAKLKELKRFAATTPFTLPGIVEASKQLEVMGGSALNTDKNLRMIGDAASFAGQDIKDVAMYFGRLYDGMKNGTPLGEVNMRLGEMGIMSGETKREIAKLADGVKDGTLTMDEAWARTSKQFSRFAGQTEKQAETLNGLWSTFTDTIDDGLATIGTKLLPTIKPALKQAITLFEGLGAAGSYLIDNIEMLVPVMIAVLVPAIYTVTAAVYKLAAGVVVATYPLIAIGTVVYGAYMALKTIDPEMQFATALFGLAADAVKLLVDALSAAWSFLQFMFEPLADLAEGLGLVKPAATEATEGVGTVVRTIDEMPGKLADSNMALQTAAEELFLPIETEASKKAREAVRTFETMNSDILTSFSETRAALTGAAGALAEAATRPIVIAAEIARKQQEIAEAEKATHGKKMSDLEKAEARAVLAEKQAGLFKLLAEDTTYGTTSERIAKLNALKSSNAYANILKNATPEQAAAYRLWIAEADKSLTALAGVASKEAAAAGSKVGPSFRGAAPTDGTFKTWGQHAGKAWADGLASQMYYLKQAAKEYASGARGELKFTEPKEGPLKNMKTWGEHAGELWADAFASRQGHLKDAVADYLTPMKSALAPSAPMTGGGGGATVTINIGTFNGTEENVNDLARKLGEAVRYSSLRSASA